jgi:hypothetical protein
MREAIREYSQKMGGVRLYAAGKIPQR